MKKTIAVLVLCVVALGAFAGSIDLDFNGMIPLTYARTETKMLSGTGITEETITSYGIDVGATLWLSKTAGLKADFTFAKPDTQKLTYSGNWNSNIQINPGTYTNHYSDNTSSTYEKKVLFLGISSVLSSNRSSKTLLVPGVILDYDTDTGNSSGSTTTTLNAGIGVEFVAQANLSNTAYLNLSVPVAYEFMQQINGNSNDDFKGRLFVSPKIGIGFRF